MISSTILLTGATGLIGHHLVPALLEAGHRVRALHRPGSDTSYLPKNHEALELVQGDILDIFTLEEAMLGCNKVIHAAALISFQAEDRHSLDQVNQEGTANVVNLALDHQVDQLIYISSVAALERESSIINPTSLADTWQSKRAPTNYAASKFAAEREIWRGQAEGLSVSTVYPSVVVGSGDPRRGGTPALFKRIKEGLSTYSTGHSAFIAVSDVVDACLHLLSTRESKRILCQGHNMSWKAFLSLAAKKLKVNPPTRKVASWQSALAWPIAGLWSKISGQKPFLTRDRHRLAHAHYTYVGDSFEKALGKPFKPIGKAIEEAI
ncbi:MAG: NAD-dependent epimerase/dehydratase family protein [Bacteroidota bacterium]